MGAIAALEDESWFQQSRARVIEGRERMNRGLIGLGFEVLPSSANFVFARHPAHRHPHQIRFAPQRRIEREEHVAVRRDVPDRNAARGRSGATRAAPTCRCARG